MPFDPAPVFTRVSCNRHSTLVSESASMSVSLKPELDVPIASSTLSHPKPRQPHDIVSMMPRKALPSEPCP
jgi:hypothetical protein